MRDNNRQSPDRTAAGARLLRGRALEVCVALGAKRGGALASVVANSMLDRNLGALLVRNPALARELAQTEPSARLEWVETSEGPEAPSAVLTGDDGVSRSLASRRSPIAEADRWAAQADVVASAVFVVRGLGLGYHVAALWKRMGGHGAVVVFEPDKRLLRTVLERIDCSGWLPGVSVLTDPQDRAALTDTVARIEPLIAMGTAVLDHPASVARLGGGVPGSPGRIFLERFTAQMGVVRMNVVSTMVQTQTTFRNCLQNLDYYTQHRGIESLRGACAGRTAVVVSAGPSLQRNVEQLARPGARDRVVIVAVQTVLRQLLERGIRPHFVCALDYHEVSARFYEGLTAEAVRGVTLIVEPKVNPAVPVAFPGRVRIAGDGFLDIVLGPDLARPMGRISAGTTVAHLAYYFARFLGCDPVCLVGQDLGFTDGQYYPAGAAIHRVWGAELGDLKTLETLEWQRIVRHRAILRRERDHLGRPVYTDEQMHTYLTQFVRDFAADAQAGRVVIDATEGGVAKQHTVAERLREVIDRALGEESGASVDELLEVVRHQEDTRVYGASAVQRRLEEVRHGACQVAELSRRAGLHLAEAAEHHQDQQRVNGLIARLESLRERVKEIEPAWTLVQLLNQTGMFKRVRTDRTLAVRAGLTDMERQRLQIDRDALNVRWLADSADALADLLASAQKTLAGAARVTRETRVSQAPDNEQASPSRPSVLGVVMHRASRTWWGTTRASNTIVLGGSTALALTVRRLATAAGIGSIVVASDDPQEAERQCADLPASVRGRLRFERYRGDGWVGGQTEVGGRLCGRVSRATRALAATSWRGGFADWTHYDETMDPLLCHTLAERYAADAVISVDASWCLIDPALVDACIDRHAEEPTLHRLTFTHAAPGLGAALLDRALCADLAQARRTGGLWGSLGGVLGYSPVAPAADLLAKAACVAPGPAVRQCLVRATADTNEQARYLHDALAAAGIDPATANATAVAAALDQHARRSPPGPTVLHAVLSGELNCTECDRLIKRIDALAGNGGGAELGTVVLADASLSNSRLPMLAAHATANGLSVVVRTDLNGGPEQVDRLLALDPDLVMVDCHADSAEVYSQLTGLTPEAFTRLRTNLEALMDARTLIGEGPVRLPLIVPRLQRCDAVYEQVEDWYDRHILACGWAVIDPSEPARIGRDARIVPLPIPPCAAERLNVTRAVYGSRRCEGCP